MRRIEFAQYFFFRLQESFTKPPWVTLSAVRGVLSTDLSSIMAIYGESAIRGDGIFFLQYFETTACENVTFGLQMM